MKTTILSKIKRNILNKLNAQKNLLAFPVLLLLLLLTSFKVNGRISDNSSQELLRKESVIDQIEKSLYGDNKPSHETQESTKKTYNMRKKIFENRLELQKRDGISSKKILTGKEKVKAIMEKNRAILKKKRLNQQKKNKKELNHKNESWLQKMKGKTLSWKKNQQGQVDSWLLQKKALIQRWKREKLLFNKVASRYKKVSLNDSSFTKLEKKLIEKHLDSEPISLPVKKSKGTFVIKSAFNPAIKNQKWRPTCSSFAAIRGIEILLAQKGKTSLNLSEQYFYWLSKPKCQKSPCQSRGSSATYGLIASSKKSSPDIPLSKDCPYNELSEKGNETQIPLSPTCFQGFAQINEFSFLTEGKTTEIIKALENDFPIIVGLKLSPNFYKNKGLVLMKDLSKKGRTDTHAKGHALLLIGHMNLPEELHQTEGKYCFLTANSWGTGWGIGGHACLSENWIKHHMKSQKLKYFVVLKKASSI